MADGKRRVTDFNLWDVFAAVAGAVPARDCLVWQGRRRSFAEVAARASRLGSFLYHQGLGLRVERDRLERHESGQSHVGLLLYNCPEYIEAMLGAFRARVAPFNVNYRYTGDELSHLLADARAEALVYHASLAPTVAAVLETAAQRPLLVQVSDDSGHPLLPGAVDYEDALSRPAAPLPPVDPSPDDLYLLYTGGTTGLPKGVLWRQHDIFLAAMGGRSLRSWQPVADLPSVAARAARRESFPVLAIAPLMHGAAQWAAFMGLTGGASLVLPDDPRRLDPADVWRTVTREGVRTVTAVGDAMARPLVEELERGHHDVSSLVAFGNGGAPLSEGVRLRLQEQLPGVILSDSVGASETGAQMSQRAGSRPGEARSAGAGFTPSPWTTVVDETRSRRLRPGHEGLGWLAQWGTVPLGYLGDREKTAETFPEIDGVRYAIPGDRARLLADGSIELLGRDSVTINSGGEKIFAEEVEQALLRHPAVADVVVAGRPSEQWGQEVVAVVELRPGCAAEPEALVEEAARTLARYKLPKQVVFVKRVERSPSGKADYRWARARAQEGAG